MRLELEEFFRYQTRLLEAGEVEQLAELFKSPLPVFHSGGIKLIASHTQIEHAMTVLHEGICEIGATRIRYRLLDITQRPGTATFSTLVDFQYLNEEKLLRTSRIRYYLERDDKFFRIAMVEYLAAAFDGVLKDPPA